MSERSGDERPKDRTNRQVARRVSLALCFCFPPLLSFLWEFLSETSHTLSALKNPLGAAIYTRGALKLSPPHFAPRKPAVKSQFTPFDHPRFFYSLTSSPPPPRPTKRDVRPSPPHFDLLPSSNGGPTRAAGSRSGGHVPPQRRCVAPAHSVLRFSCSTVDRRRTGGGLKGGRDEALASSTRRPGPRVHTAGRPGPLRSR
ncbi:hypothetical protein NL676_024544 [Syzygium grande]|nr:hypothetical protein NL676_024544 [Syzygium grande]